MMPWSRPICSLLIVYTMVMLAGCFSLPRLTVPADVDEARLERAIKHNPENIHAHFLLGRAALQENEPRRALHHFRKVLELDDTFEEAWHGIGIAHLDRGHYRTAARHFEKMAEKFPANHRAREGQASAALARGDISATRHHATIAATRNPQSAAAQRLLGEAAYADGEYADAVNHWKRAMELNPDLTGALRPIVADLEKFKAR
ncbi:MAG: tetratricopeptide repeat protein [Candidatus Sumerlaeia bacterium]|nr:tetratricopeptide repeat protein [Candidatus Sumerlaeia bacterium]